MGLSFYSQRQQILQKQSLFLYKGCSREPLYEFNGTPFAEIINRLHRTYSQSVQIDAPSSNQIQRWVQTALNHCYWSIYLSEPTEVWRYPENQFHIYLLKVIKKSFKITHLTIYEKYDRGGNSFFNSLSKHNCSSILKLIEPIQFQNLVYLQITEVFLKNLESFTFFNCPKLSRIYIEDHHSASAECFSKLNLPLVEFQIYSNSDLRIQKLSRMKLSSKMKDWNITLIKKSFSQQENVKLQKDFQAWQKLTLHNNIIKLQYKTLNYSQSKIRDLKNKDKIKKTLKFSNFKFNTYYIRY